jgi:hypothetical protein
LPVSPTQAAQMSEAEERELIRAMPGGRNFQ